MNRNRIVSSLFVFSSLLVLSACKDDSSSPQTIQVSVTDAVEVVGSSLADSTGGIASQIRDLASVIGGGMSLTPPAPTSPSTPADTIHAYVNRSRNGGLYTYNYNFHFWYSPSLTYLGFGFEMGGTYDTPRLASDDTAHAEWRATNLAAPEVTLNGTYERNGSETWKLREKSIKSEIDITLVNVTVDRLTGYITGGSATLVVSVEPADGVKASYVAAITFLGNQRASIAINGKTYILDLGSGAVQTP